MQSHREDQSDQSEKQDLDHKQRADADQQQPPHKLVNKGPPGQIFEDIQRTLPVVHQHEQREDLRP